MDNKLGSAYVEVVTRGMDKVQSDLNKVKASTASTVTALETMNRIGTASALVFGGVSASITGFIAAADPAGFLKFQNVLARLSVQIGSIFLPILDSVTAALQVVLEWFRGLSNETKDQISYWVGIGLAVTGAAAAMKLAAVAAGALSAITGGLSLVTAAAAIQQGIAAAATAVWAVVQGILSGAITLSTIATAAFGVAAGIASGGILPLIGAIATLAGTLLVGAKAIYSSGNSLSWLGSIFASFKPIIGAFSGLFSGIWTVVSSVVSAIVAVFGMLANVVGGAVSTIGSVLSGLAPVIRLIGDVFGAVFGGIAWAIDQVIKSLIYLQTLLYQIARFNFFGASGKARAAVDDYEKSKTGKDDKKPGRHQGEAIIKPELMGLVDAWKKAQTSTMMTPEQAKQQEIIELDKKALKELEAINRGVNKGKGSTSNDLPPLTPGFDGLNP